MGFEKGELRVVAVAAGRTLQDLLGEQGLAPGGDEALGVEIAEVKGPEAHEGKLVYAEIEVELCAAVGGFVVGIEKRVPRSTTTTTRPDESVSWRAAMTMVRSGELFTGAWT
jgi:hypothetical protein